MDKSEKLINKDTIRPSIIRAEYAIRGAVIEKADELAERMRKGEKLPFKKFWPFNIGNPLAIGQPALTFNREVLAAALQPGLLNSEAISKDARERAKKFLDTLEGPHALGAYTESQGFPAVRESVKKFIEARDGHPANVNNLFLYNGASEGFANIMSILISSPKDAIMIPIPQYPLYTAIITVENGTPVPYHLDEGKEWNFDTKDAEENLKKARAEGYNVKALIANNPGNPAGQVMTEEGQREIVKFCYDNKLLLLADEVYQGNNLGVLPFISFKKIIHDMGAPYNKLELVSFHSAAKGIPGECGLKGGYMELENIDPFVQGQLVKIRAVSLCSNTVGQLVTEVIANPPKEGVNSPEVVELFKKEWNMIEERYKKGGQLLYEKINKMPRMSVTRPKGAMACFPKIDLTESAIKAAREKGLNPDTMFCLEGVEHFGLVMTPGSGFKQKEGTYHIRLTNMLFDLKEFEEALDTLHKFAEYFFNKYP